MQRAWIAVVVVVGVALGIAIAGVPSRHRDPPLHVVSAASATSTTVGPGGTTPTTVTPAAHQPNQVAVIVVSAGSTTSPETVSDQIKAAGYTTSTPEVDHEDAVSTSLIQYAAGYEADASAIAAIINLPNAQIQPIDTSPVPSKYAGNNNVIVILGSA